MRERHRKSGGQETPELLKKMGLDSLYQEYVQHALAREKTRRDIWIKNPDHYASPAWKQTIYNWTEDADCIYAETMFGRRETFCKKELYKY